MKLYFTFLFSLLFLNFTFAQPQKGDYFFGTSNFTYNHLNEDDRIINFSPTFGGFVAKNTLIGATWSIMSDNRSNPSTDIASDGTETQVSIFINQFIGKSKIKGLTGFQLSYTGSSTFSHLQLGAAFFPVDNASINLIYSISPFSVERGNFEVFPNKFRPDIGLSMRFFFLRNREQKEEILARNSIKAGTKAIGLTGSFDERRWASDLFFRGTSKFFFTDHFYLIANLQNLTTFYVIESRTTKYNIVPQIGVGHYANISENVVLGITTLFSFPATNVNVGFERLNLRTRSCLITAGCAIFKGRHKIEPTIGADFVSTKMKDEEVDNSEALNLQFGTEYEYFLGKNTSLTGLLTFLPQNKTFQPTNFGSSNDVNFGFVGRERNLVNFLIGFNYYIMR
jgi:hypothetical protein